MLFFDGGLFLIELWFASIVITLLCPEAAFFGEVQKGREAMIAPTRWESGNIEDINDLFEDSQQVIRRTGERTPSPHHNNM